MPGPYWRVLSCLRFLARIALRIEPAFFSCSYTDRTLAAPSRRCLTLLICRRSAPRSFDASGAEIIGREFQEVAGSAAAVEVWAALYPAGDAAGLPEQIIEQVVSAIETRHSVGLHVLIKCVCKLIGLKLLRAEDATRLDEALGDLNLETAYENIDLDSKQATSVSLLRAACVQLARSLQDSGVGAANANVWLTSASTDPLPEVRFALA